MGFLHTGVIKYQQAGIFTGKLRYSFGGNPGNQDETQSMPPSEMHWYYSPLPIIINSAIQILKCYTSKFLYRALSIDVKQSFHLLQPINGLRI